MSHEIFGKRFVSARNEPAWHHLITELPNGGEGFDLATALRIGKIDFDYQTVPMGYTTPGGAFVNSDQKQVILRSPTEDDPIWREMGVVSHDYQFLQTKQLAAGLDAIAKATGWSFETAGALQRGATVFMTLNCGKRSVFGDDYVQHLIVSDGKAQSRALQIAIAPVRVVCNNTLLASDTAALSQIRIAHDASVGHEYDFWLGLIEQLQTAQDRSFDALETMASHKISDEEAMSVIEATFPLPGKTRKASQAEALLAQLPNLTQAQTALLLLRSQAGEDRKDEARRMAAERRFAAWICYQRFNEGQEHGVAEGGRVVAPDTLEQIRNTPYAALQAVVEIIDWAGIAKAETAAASSLFGIGAEGKRRAWDSALSLASR